MDATFARADMFSKINSIVPVPKYINRGNNFYRRQTLSEKNHGDGGFWVMYRWGLEGYELHVHYKPNGSVNADHIKVAGSNMRGGQCYISGADVARIRQKIQPPPIM